MKTKKLISELEKIDKMKWASIYCTLNGWAWPDELKHIKPKWWDRSVIMDRKSKIIDPLINHIERTLGSRWISREWNKIRMNEAEHNKWWIKNYVGSSVKWTPDLRWPSNQS